MPEELVFSLTEARVQKTLRFFWTEDGLGVSAKRKDLDNGRGRGFELTLEDAEVTALRAFLSGGDAPCGGA